MIKHTSQSVTLLLFILILNFFSLHANQPIINDSTEIVKQLSVLVIPYKPMMHLSDADNDIARYSDIPTYQVRSELRKGLMRNLNSNLQLEYQSKIPQQDFVQNDSRDMEMIYNSLGYSTDTIYPLKKKTVKDTLAVSKTKSNKDEKTKPKDKTYINVDFYDQQLLPDLAGKYDADLFVFLNELDIKTNFNDCLDLALKIYQRELKVHYTIFDRRGHQVYGDVAVVYFPSNSNDVNEIIDKNFPGISSYILDSVKRIHPGY